MSPCHPRADVGATADDAALAEPGALADLGEVPHAAAGADLGGLVDLGGGLDPVVHCDAFRCMTSGAEHTARRGSPCCGPGPSCSWAARYSAATVGAMVRNQPDVRGPPGVDGRGGEDQQGQGAQDPPADGVGFGRGRGLGMEPLSFDVMVSLMPTKEPPPRARTRAPGSPDGSHCSPPYPERAAAERPRAATRSPWWRAGSTGGPQDSGQGARVGQPVRHEAKRDGRRARGLDVVGGGGGQVSQAWSRHLPCPGGGG